MFDSGYFAREAEGDVIAWLIRQFPAAHEGNLNDRLADNESGRSGTGIGNHRIADRMVTAGLAQVPRPSNTAILLTG